MQTKRCWIAAALAATGLWTSVLAGETADTARFLETRLGPVPDPVTILLTPDRREAVYVMPKDGVRQVYLGGRPDSPEFEGIFVPKSFVRSRDGRRAAYAVVKETKPGDCNSCAPLGEWRAVIDGVAGPVYDRVNGLVFSPDGKHVAYGAMLDSGGRNLWHLVQDGRETLLPYDALSHLSPAFSPDGRHLVYVALKGEKTVVVVDGQESEAWDKVGAAIPVFSADGKHMAYTARNYGEPESVVLDGKPGPGFEAIPASSLIFSAEGGRFAYGGQHQNGRWSAVVDGVVGPEYEQVDRLAFSRDGRHFAYQAKKEGRWVLIADGQEVLEGEEFAQEAPAFSPDGRRLAQALRKDGSWKVVAIALDPVGKDVLTGAIGGDFAQGAGLVTFSADGRHIAWIGWQGRKRMAVLDGVRGPEFDAIANLVFSPDGRRLAYEAARLNQPDPAKPDAWFVVVDHEPRPEYEGLLRGSVIFSADSRHFAYSASQGDKRLLIVDGQASPGYKTVCSVLPAGERGFEALVVGDGLCRVGWKPL